MNARELFEILVREHVDMVRAFLLASVRDATVADDLVQEAFLVAWRNLDRYDRELPFGPWVRGIAGKLVLAHRRKTGRSKVLYCDEESLTALDRRFDSIQGLPGDTFDERMHALRNCMTALTPNQREAIRLHYDEGLDCRAIADRMEIGFEAVKKHLQRGRAALMRCMETKSLREASA